MTTFEPAGTVRVALSKARFRDTRSMVTVGAPGLAVIGVVGVGVETGVIVVDMTGVGVGIGVTLVDITGVEVGTGGGVAVIMVLAIVGDGVVWTGLAAVVEVGATGGLTVVAGAVEGEDEQAAVKITAAAIVTIAKYFLIFCISIY
jgi:hypothetical protein